MDDDDLNCEGYDLKLVPETANDDMKTGVTFKGNDPGYFEGHRVLKEITKKKGERFLINGVEIGISDTPKNKPINVEVKPKNGLSGKANLTIFEKNNRGGATIMISKVKGGESNHAKILGIKVIKYLLDGVIEGKIKEEDILQFKMKNTKVVEKKSVSIKKTKCLRCDKVFQTEQGLKAHMTRLHKDKGKYCEICRITSKDEEDFKHHLQLEHAEVVSPQAKKRKRDLENEDILVDDEKVLDENLHTLEEQCWEEARLNHREIEIQVNEEELKQMKEFDDKKRKLEINEKLKGGRNMEEENDEKVLKKQMSWFEEEVKFQEMKRKMTEERLNEEKKRKRQLSIDKKKKNKSKKGKVLKEDIEEVIDLVREFEKEEGADSTDGPGYMGWKSEDENALNIQRAFQDIRKDMQNMENKIIELNREKIEHGKDIKNLKDELKNMKGEYKLCLEALAKETYEKNKLQSINKVLQDTLETEKIIVNQEADIIVEHSVKEMSLQEEQEPMIWTEQNQNENTRRNVGKKLSCDNCHLELKDKTDLDRHIKNVHARNPEHKCTKCEQVFVSKEEQRQHTITLHADKVFNCQICSKPYTSMTLLRRHDWRSHREVDCNMCGDKIKSRSDIKKHREIKHQISQKVFCKYFPNCLDGEECLFLHESVPGGDSVCPEGEDCNNQSCNFSEQSHLKTKLLCIFQANCNRLNCPFKHTVPRKAFLGEGFKSNQEN